MPSLLDRTGLRADTHPTLLPLAEFLAAGGTAPAVLLGPADDPEALVPHLGALQLIAVEFPRFTDGRGRSIARLLRERLGYAGPLRAVGDVAVDQIFALARCGFDQFLLRDGDDPAVALSKLASFTEVYQAGVDRGPLFERRFPRSAA